jgi:probable O-glycosylation ligase (exosortase A-associated)
MQSIFLFAIYCAFLVIGSQAPFVLALGYVWIDLFRPQVVNPGIMGMFPLSMIMGGLAMLAYFGMDRRDPPRFAPVLGIMVLFAAWMVVSTYLLAVLPIDAQGKHSWAFKTVVFAIIIPFIFRSRVQIEAFVLTVLAASSGNAMAFAFKMVVGGSFYGQALGLSRSDTGFGESSTFSMVCAALVPLVLFATRHSVILPTFRYRNAVGVLGCAGLVLALLGTHARTGLVALAVLAGLLWLQSRNKMLISGLFGGLFLFGLPLVLPFLGDRWLQRMDTILNPTQEASALGRIAGWEWTWHYVKQNPLGGGFEVYRISRFSTTMADGTPFQIAGKAFHSIYFEVLGELGFPGFIMLMSMFALTFMTLLRIRHETRQDPDLAWLHDLSRALIASLIIYMAGGAFVGIAFQPLHYMWFSMTVALTAYIERYRRLQGAGRGPSMGWSRHVASRPASGVAGQLARGQMAGQRGMQGSD